MDYQVAFVVLQIVFALLVTWFIRLLLKFSKDLKDLDYRVSKNKENLNIHKAVVNEKHNNLIDIVLRVESKIDAITVLQTR
jgi:hypothetical protein